MKPKATASPAPVAMYGACRGSVRMRYTANRIVPSGARPLTGPLLMRAALLLSTLMFLVALILYGATAAPTITTRHGGTDGGELAATALSGGVPHPSGYPTYMLFARLALRWPWGEPAGRIALLSVVAGALAVACTAMLVIRSTTTGGMPALVAGTVAALTLALSPRLWAQT